MNLRVIQPRAAILFCLSRSRSNLSSSLWNFLLSISIPRRREVDPHDESEAIVDPELGARERQPPEFLDEANEPGFESLLLPSLSRRPRRQLELEASRTPTSPTAELGKAIVDPRSVREVFADHIVESQPQPDASQYCCQFDHRAFGRTDPDLSEGSDVFDVESPGEVNNHTWRGRAPPRLPRGHFDEAVGDAVEPVPTTRPSMRDVSLAAAPFLGHHQLLLRAFDRRREPVDALVDQCQLTRGDQSLDGAVAPTGGNHLLPFNDPVPRCGDLVQRSLVHVSDRTTIQSIRL